MAEKNSLAMALRTVRKARGLSQEAFSDVSSRTYLSSLERDLKSPTLNKLAELCEVMEIHPMTLLALAYAGDAKGVDLLVERVRREIAELKDASDTV
ncbi:helix-turn-helix domain-containing protein [Ectopseudomonas oleovorans]|uniref:helix-turn-helix domain-containing protein n=1 Tax=Ectopseudomonas oleovorans TaxID=301 RepID=UPI000CF0D711|nr:helix-turn-helix transcriptional regulator [Pseudomonas oleovorans]PPV42019.1 XRE family transcriptional regulator [Pseudomonas oleovorans]